MISNDLINETLLISKESTHEERQAIIRDIEQKMENETNPTVLAFFDWYISVLKSWNEPVSA